jgi:hypothetical protein
MIRSPDPFSCVTMQQVMTMVLAAMLLLLGACEPTPEPEETADAVSVEEVAASVTARSDSVLARELARAVAYADSIEAALRPVPLLTRREARAFDRYRNTDQLAVARRLGVPQHVTAAARERLIEEGRLVPLGDSDYWAVRDLDHSTALVTPDVVALLTEIGERFQARLDELDLPPLRLEVTSVLRTADDQADLRRVNPNATGGTSTHQFGTTVDVAYSSFRAPAAPVVDFDTTEAPWLGPHLRRVEHLAAETGAARMSRELQAELAKVLRAMQDEGKVMVTMEVRQPVFHMTVAQPY